jgi:hypothetical protein
VRLSHGLLQIQLTERWALPVCLADSMVGLDGIFLVHMLFTVRPTCSGINVWLLEDTKKKKKKVTGHTSNCHDFRRRGIKICFWGKDEGLEELR